MFDQFHSLFIFLKGLLQRQIPLLQAANDRV